MLFSGNHFVITQFNVFQGGDGHGEVDDEYCFLGTMLSLLNSIYPMQGGRRDSNPSRIGERRALSDYFIIIQF